MTTRATTRATTKTASSSGRDMTSELAFLTRALKAPTLREAVPRLAERARAESWTHEEFLTACLGREVSARESHGGEGRIRAARFPARKSLEEFDFDHARGLKRDLIAHLGTLDFVTARDNVVFLGPPGTGKTHLATGIAIRACQGGHRVLFATASQWVDRLATRPPRRPPPRRTRPPRPLPTTGHRRGRLHPLRTRSREPVLPARVLPIRTRLTDRHLQQDLRPLGRSLRRRRRRRSHDRPPGPPRRSHQPQRRLLPPQRPRPRTHPHQHHHRQLTRPTNPRWSDFSRRSLISFQPPLTTCSLGLELPLPLLVIKPPPRPTLTASPEGHAGLKIVGARERPGAQLFGRLHTPRICAGTDEEPGAW